MTTITTKKVNELSNLGNIEDGDILVGERPSGTTVTFNFNGVLQDGEFSSNGLMTRTAAGTYANRTITGTADRVSVTNGNGASGNPVLDIASTYVGQTSITTLGTIATGTWQGTAIDSAYIADAFLKNDGDTGTGSFNFGGADDFEIPNGTAPVVDTDGQIALDTSVADFSHGVLKYYGGEEMAVVAMPIAQLTTPTDGYVVSYNATNDEFELVESSGGVSGPVSSTDNAVVRWDGAGGDTVQNSSITIDDSDVLSGASQINVDNLRLDGNTLSSTSGDLNQDAPTSAKQVFSINTSEILRLDASGISFNSGTDYLNDYEEEDTTHTPTVSFSTPGTSSFSYSNQSFEYSKIGNMLFFSIDLRFTPTIGTGSGTLSITLPEVASALGSGQILFLNNAFTWNSRTSVALFIPNGSSELRIRVLGSGVGGYDLAASDLTNSVEHIVQSIGWYFV